MGGIFEGFAVGPAANGFCTYYGVPEHLGWVPLWSGIGVNLLCGLAAIGAASRRKAMAGHTGLALLAVGTVNSAQALGYSLLGALSGDGDSAALKSELGGGSHAVVVTLLVAAYLVLLDWGIRQLARLVDHQFAPPDPDARRRWFLATVLAPFAILAVARPPSTVFSPTVDWAARAGLVLVIGTWGWWRSGAPMPEPESRRPVGWRGATAWLSAALALGVVTAVWASKGVEVG